WYGTFIIFIPVVMFLVLPLRLVLKGAQSGVWGADASAGVINIITKKAKVVTYKDSTSLGNGSLKACLNMEKIIESYLSAVSPIRHVIKCTNST
ncbi:MAG TPA: hypothetical protein EYP22_02525, partial [Methanosarcinales archaeon]|nr:hypothetical protein [Methanosarcinales archaeon]